jgi:DNA-binding beta-propeller fold protein YncE
VKVVDLKKFKSLHCCLAYVALVSMSCTYIPKSTSYSYCNNILVATNQAIESFLGTASGTAVPDRIVTDSGGVTSAYGVAVDTLNAEMYLTDNATGNINVYALDSETGTHTPVRRITGVTGVRGIAVDPFHDELYVTSSTSNSLFIYSRTATGGAAPVRTLTSDGTSLRQPYSVAVDPLHGEVFVSCWQDDTIQSFPRTANGASTPTRKIGGSNTHLLNVSQLLYDIHLDQIIIASEYPAIGFFDRTATGNVKPAKEIAGTNTGLSLPAGIAADFASNQLAVVDSGTVYVFDRFDSGNVAPKTTFTHSTLSTGAHAALYNCNDD